MAEFSRIISFFKSWIRLNLHLNLRCWEGAAPNLILFNCWFGTRLVLSGPFCLQKKLFCSEKRFLLKDSKKMRLFFLVGGKHLKFGGFGVY